jgi:hypothetical protein
MGSGDKLYDEGLCGALWVVEGGSDISEEQTRSGVPYMVWILKTPIAERHVPSYNSLINTWRLGKTKENYLTADLRIPQNITRTILPQEKITALYIRQWPIPSNILPETTTENVREAMHSTFYRELYERENFLVIFGQIGKLLTCRHYLHVLYKINV